MKTRDEAIAALRELAKKPAPKQLSPGAMCYSMAMPPATHEHVCTICGERTRYAMKDTGGMIGGLKKLLGGKAPEDPHPEVRDLNQSGCVRVLMLDHVRRLAGEIRELPVTLEESEFCRNCCPTVPAPGPSLFLVVRWSGQEEHRVRNISQDDITLLKELNDGKETHAGGFGQESPLKNHLKRISELLGIEPDKVGL